MPKAETSNPFGGTAGSAGRYRPNWVAALICLVLTSTLFYALTGRAERWLGGR